MKKITTFLVIAIAANIAAAQNKISFTQPGYTRFVMPNGVTAEDYLPKTIIFAMKNQYRPGCRVGGVDGIAMLNDYLAQLGAVSPKKMFPAVQQPATERNTNGQKLADLSLIYSFQYTSNVQLEKVINRMLSMGCFEYVQPYYIPKPTLTPNDPSIGLQAHFGIINAFNAYNLSTGSTSVTIGITDTGTEYTHSDLGNIQYNTGDGPAVNGVDDDGDTYIDNYQGWDVSMNDRDATFQANAHGVHVSGLAAASTNNSNGVAGVGWQCRYLPVKISDAGGTLNAAYQGITYAADHGCQIINCSWGGPGAGPMEQSVMTYASINKNCLVVCAAGNNSNNALNFPSALNYAFSVVATNNNDTKASYSSYGYTCDVCAPGNDYSTWAGNSYTTSSGTSMASPVTAGAAGVVKSFFPSYTGLQVGERLKITADNIDGLNPSYTNQLGNGRINLFRALNDPAAPSVVNTARTITDNNDGAFIFGDTLRIFGDHTNYLAPTSTSCTATLSTTSAYATVLNSSVNLGVLGTLATVNNNSNPFTVRILSGAPINTVVTFQLTYTAGAYTQSYWFDVTINVDYINININDIGTTITSRGRIGWNSDGQMDGLGFTYLVTNQMMYESSLMIGTSSTKVSDMFRGTVTSGGDVDNQSIQNAYKVLPGLVSEFDVYGKFRDNLAPSPINVITNHKAWAWTTPGNTKYVMVEYVIKNNGATTLNNLYAGIVTDWDVMNYSLNKANQDAGLKLGYVYSTEPGGLYAGVKILTSTPFVHYGIDNIAGGGGGVDPTAPSGSPFVTSEKYTVLSTNRPTAGGAGGGNDVMDCVSSGPFTIAAGDSVKVAFALLAGDNLTDLQSSATNAQIQYDGLTTTSSDNSLGEFSLAQNYPNPVNENSTIIEFTLLGQASVELNLVDVMGKNIGTIASGEFGKGTHAFTYDVSKLASGIYYYQLKANEKSITRKMVVTH